MQIVNFIFTEIKNIWLCCMFLLDESADILHFFEKNNKKQKSMHFSKKKQKLYKTKKKYV